MWEDVFHSLNLAVDGKDFNDVRVVMAFPISRKADYVCFLDANGEELALLTSPEELDSESRKVLDVFLARHYHVPRISRIDSIRETWGVTHWCVMTDCGYAELEVADRENIRKLPGNRYIILDADGNRFEIENAALLDSRSQALLRGET